MNACQKPIPACAFCGAPGERHRLFIEERVTSRKPAYLRVGLSVCRRHEDPFCSDTSGAIPQMLLARTEDGRKIVLVCLADDAVWGERRRLG
jgi:hypothetical protein